MQVIQKIQNIHITMGKKKEYKWIN